MLVSAYFKRYFMACFSLLVFWPEFSSTSNAVFSSWILELIQIMEIFCSETRNRWNYSCLSETSTAIKVNFCFRQYSSVNAPAGFHWHTLSAFNSVPCPLMYQFCWRISKHEATKFSSETCSYLRATFFCGFSSWIWYELTQWSQGLGKDNSHAEFREVKSEL